MAGSEKPQQAPLPAPEGIKKEIAPVPAAKKTVDVAAGKLDKLEGTAGKVHQLAADRNGSVDFVKRVLANAENQSISPEERADIKLSAQKAIDALGDKSNDNQAAREDILLAFIYPMEAFAVKSL